MPDPCAMERSTVPTDPVVCCVCLVNGREAMVRRAVQSFRAQTYERKRLYIYDTGATPCTDSLPDVYPEIVYHRAVNRTGETIGKLRNVANWWGVRRRDIIAHWDSDDASHPNRLAEQVALLQSSRAECVGYNQAVFWDERMSGAAWIYTSMVPKDILGASMCYWRTAWERKPFPDRQTGEDRHWLHGVKVCGVSALPGGSGPFSDGHPLGPRFIASVHGTNTTKTNPCEGPREWQRSAQLDGYCRVAMRLEK